MVAKIFADYLTTRCGGVVIEDIQFRKLPALDEGTMVLKTLKFIPRSLCHTDVSKHKHNFSSTKIILIDNQKVKKTALY